LNVEFNKKEKFKEKKNQLKKYTTPPSPINSFIVEKLKGFFCIFFEKKKGIINE